MNRWDQYFLNICNTIGAHSSCLSRQIGAIIVRDKSIISTGYNGPPRGVPHCGHERFMLDNRLKVIEGTLISDVNTICPRYIMGAKSGDMLDLCIAAHAEMNCIANAAKLGVSVDGATMYMNTEVCCRYCMAIIINAGIEELVVTESKVYDESSKFMTRNSTIKVRLFGEGQIGTIL